MSEKIESNMTYAMNQIESGIAFYTALTRNGNPSKDLMEESDKLFRKTVNKILDKYLRISNG